MKYVKTDGRILSMKEIFDADFVKFLIGFLAIITLTLGVILITEQVMENDAGSSADSIQVIPPTSTTTSGQ